MPDVGDHVCAGKGFGEIESVKAVNRPVLPGGRRGDRGHGKLEEKPDPITADPFGDGWIVKVRVEKATALDHLLTPAAYKRQVDKEAR